jgi:hypothetical protein
LALALRDSSVEFARDIFECGSFFTDLQLIWTAEHERGMPMWIAYTHETMKFLLIATPDISVIGDGKIAQRIYDYFLMKSLPTNSALLKVFFITGNRLPAPSMAALSDSLSLFDREWLKRLQTPQSLQFYARLSVRRNMACNIYFGAKFLPIPHKLIEYLTACEELE